MNDSTKVQVEGRTSTVDQIQEGQQARVSYETSTNGPTAVMIRVRGAGAAASGSGTGSTGDSSAPALQAPPSQQSSTAPQGGAGTQ